MGLYPALNQPVLRLAGCSEELSVLPVERGSIMLQFIAAHIERHGEAHGHLRRQSPAIHLVGGDKGLP
jgi:hypothetical protein